MFALIPDEKIIQLTKPSDESNVINFQNYLNQFEEKRIGEEKRIENEFIVKQTLSGLWIALDHSRFNQIPEIYNFVKPVQIDQNEHLTIIKAGGVCKTIGYLNNETEIDFYVNLDTGMMEFNERGHKKIETKVTTPNAKLLPYTNSSTLSARIFGYKACYEIEIERKSHPTNANVHRYFANIVAYKRISTEES